MSAEKTNGQTTERAAGPPMPVIPKWIEAKLFEETFKKEIPDFAKIKDFKVEKAMAAGENYATLMLGIKAEIELKDGKTKTFPFMMKVCHDLEIMKEMRKTHNIFDVELGMYSDIVPEFEEMYRQKGLNVKFGAKLYLLNNAADDYILLEDLRMKGFKNANRLEGLDMDHVKCVLKKLAQWHAASATRYETKGPYDKIYALGFFNGSTEEMMAQFLDSLASNFLKCVKTYEGHEAYIDDLQHLTETQKTLFAKLGEYDLNEFNVLNHGDCWSNNVMFQYDAFGKIKETYFVDYQIPKYGSPAQDLLYFLLSSTKLEIKLKHFDYFIKYYYDQLIEHLTLLQYPKAKPALRDIHMMLFKYGMWGYSTATGVMGVVLLDPTESASLENFLESDGEGDKFKMLMYSNARYKKHIEQILPWLHNRGVMSL